MTPCRYVSGCRRPKGNVVLHKRRESVTQRRNGHKAERRYVDKQGCENFTCGRLTCAVLQNVRASYLQDTAKQSATSELSTLISSWILTNASMT
jgi:hypothetical protein